MTEEEKEETAKRICTAMEEAADKDLDAVREKKPGLHKLRTLKFALATCSRRDLQETLLAFNLCGVAAEVDRASPDGGLTSLDLRTRMYQAARRAAHPERPPRQLGTGHHAAVHAPGRNAGESGDAQASGGVVDATRVPKDQLLPRSWHNYPRA